MLRGHIGRRAVANVGSVQLSGQGRQTEIGDQHLPPSVDHDVGRFQVAMQHALVVGGRETRAQLARDLHGFIGRQASDAPQQGVEVLAIHVLHRKERGTIRFADIVNPADVGVRNLARDAHLGVEAREHLLVLGGGLRQELERHGLAQLEIVGPVHFAHAALAEESDDAVALGEDRAGRESAFLRGVGRCGRRRVRHGVGEQLGRRSH